jgi:hypothetical protein
MYEILKKLKQFKNIKSIKKLLLGGSEIITQLTLLRAFIHIPPSNNFL